MESENIVAKTILQQLGGTKFLAMTGSKNLTTTKYSLNMNLSKNNASAKFLTVELEENDTYTMTFSKLKKGTFEFIICQQKTGVLFDQMQAVFTEVTGLRTSL